MAFIRQYLLPLAIVLIFSAALLAVSARIFLPTDLAAPAPVGWLLLPLDGPAWEVLPSPWGWGSGLGDLL